MPCRYSMEPVRMQKYSSLSVIGVLQLYDHEKSTVGMKLKSNPPLIDHREWKADLDSESAVMCWNHP
jgi:hypothetical protein